MTCVLGIETSCDETGVAIFDTRKGLLAHQLHSQVAVHQTYGGVVPELASRDHIRRCLPLVRQTLQSANCSLNDLDGIAYTAGPGLIGALMVGVVFARSLAVALDLPAIGVHHLEGHLLSPCLDSKPPPFPYLALLVSGGHTLLAAVDAPGQYRLLGQSLDDAAGEAFDKTAKLIGLPYPGGPALAQLAERGDPTRFAFPRPMLDRPGLDMSFSGLKSAVQRHWAAEVNSAAKADRLQALKCDMAASFQAALIDVLLEKCRRAAQQTGYQHWVVAGGVSANTQLRIHLQTLAQQYQAQLYCPRLEFCTDNGAMIAYAGAQRLAAGQHEPCAIRARARWPLYDLPPITQ